jgi:uncharacterized protein involved in response to NO
MPRSLILPNVSNVHRSAPHPWLAKGFRPFFLLAALFGIGAIPLWLMVLRGHVIAPPYLTPTTVHAHEMVYGYAVGVLAGFLLTAVGNWTKRETATGQALLALTLLWAAGRLAMLLSGVLPPIATAVVDLSFLPALIFVLARPLVATDSRRNYVMLGVLGALWLTNVAIHGEALGWRAPGSGRRAGLTGLNLLVLVISIMAARIFPMFTKNATGVASIRSMPRLDRASVGALLLAVVLDIAVPGRPVTAAAFGIAGLLTTARSWHWGARHSGRDPLLWILHLGHGWLCLGLLLRSAELFGLPAVGSIATHALTVGAVGGLTLGMMARVSLGHTGRMIIASVPTALAFAAINLAALVRCVGPLIFREHYMAVLVVSGTAWALSFTLFVATYATILLRPRVDGRAG